MNDVNGSENNNEIKKHKKGNGPIYWVIVIVGVAFIVAASFNIGMKVGKIAEGNVTSGSDKTDENSNNVESNSNESSNMASNVTETPKVVSQETLNYLLDVLGISNSQGGDSWLLFSIYKIQGVVNEKLSASDKYTITKFYAEEHKMLTDISGNQYKYCAESSCQGILKTDFAKIAKLYGITDDPTKIFKPEQIYGNYYIYEGGVGGVMSIKNTNIKAQYSGNDIIVTTDLTVSSPDGVSDRKAMTYTFKLNNENSYYLYSVSSK